MDFAFEMMKHSMTGRFSPEELIIAKTLSTLPNVREMLIEISRAAVLIVSTTSIPDSLTAFVKSQLIVKTVIFPIGLIELLSTSSSISAKFNAATIASFFQKVFGFMNARLIGVITFSLGVSLNGFSSPGPLIWHLIHGPQFKTTVTKIEVVLSMAFSDCFTKAQINATDRFSKEVKEVDMSLLQIAAEASNMLVTSCGLTDAATNMVCSLVLSLPRPLRKTHVDVVEEVDVETNQLVVSH